MSLCDTCTNQDGAECVGCRGWLKNMDQQPRAKLLEVVDEEPGECRHCDIKATGWGVVRPSNFHYPECPLRHGIGVAAVYSDEAGTRNKGGA